MLSGTRSARASAGAAFAAGLLLFTASAAGAAEQVIVLNYEIHVAGAYGVLVDTVTQVTPERYVTQATVRKDGILSALTKKYRVQDVALGRFSNDKVVPVEMRAAVQSGDDQRTIRFVYDGSGTISASEQPPYKPKPGREIGDSQRVATFDPLNAAVVAFLGRTDPCGAPVRIFDGRRRFDLVSERRGMEKLPDSEYEAVKGKALRCDVRLQKVAGYSKSDQHDDDMSRPARLWLASLDDSGRLYPVRLEIDTGFGQVVARVSKFASRPMTLQEKAAMAR